jgi:hypothetical protein
MPALPLLPEFIGILWAVLIAIFAFIGAKLLTPVFVELGKALAWLPGFILDRLTQAQNAIVAFFVHLAPDAIGTLVNVISAAAGISRHVTDAIAGAIDASLHAVAYITQQAIPWILQHIQDYYNALQGWAAGEFRRLEGLLDWRIRAAMATLLALLQSAFSAAVANFQQQFKGLQDEVGWVWATVTAALGATLNAARLYTDQRAHQVETAAAADVHAVASELGAAERALRDKIDESSRNAEAFAAKLVLDARNFASLADQQALAQALTATGAIALSLEAIRQLECIKQCGPLGQLGNDLQALDLAALLALLLGAASHPQEGAQAVTALLGPGARFAHDEIRQLFGAA